MTERLTGTLGQNEEKGLGFVSEVLGEPFAQSMRTFAGADEFGAPICRMALNFAMADAWGHEGIDRKKKSIAVMSALIATGQSKELKNHVKIGLANGLTVAEFEGLLIQLVPYLGFPCIATATTTMVEALREAGVPLTVQTAEEQGLL